MIIITRHAEDRIKERTKLTPEDVKCLLENNVFCPLGKDEEGNGELFHLFFSQPNNAFFIAVLTADETFLQTVLCQHHSVPVKVNKTHRKKARQSYYKWFFERNVVVAEEKLVPALLRIYVNSKQEFSIELGEVLASRYSTAEKIVAEQLSLFQTIISSVDTWLLMETAQTKSVRYEFFTKSAFSKRFILRLGLKHKTVLRLLEPDVG